ncbi:MAG: N-acetyltransferase [Bacteroidetes bacterium]|nr:MAG: N-acetyltransferase [Bacteroidota bacterium]REK04705.1 MAG: N-acetyltransferase [Bacteroidota bacterium]REK36179.1 MAG: N-acetyltransferase [Bacteroidota bacterium]REK51450.1 MAG: N-acetyltransferase [Bacteroidota bacterium]
MVNIRAATEADLKAILDIYNDAVLNTTATFDTEPRSMQKQIEWFRNHKEKHPVLVAELDGMIAGWASLSPWSDRCAYDTTVEVSVYIHSAHRSKGLGTMLLKIVTLKGGEKGNHTVISRITQGNETSIHIHEKLGYRHIGIMKEVGYKFGHFLDVHMMQFIYS